MPHYGSLSLKDYSDEISSFSVYFGPVTVGTIAGLLTQWGTLRTTVDALTLGTLAKEQLVMDNTVLSNDRPASSAANVELKWLVTYEGTTSHKKFRFEIPTPDTSLLVPGTDEIDMTVQAVIDFVAAFEAIGKTPDSDAEGVNVLKIKLVGRNI